MTLAALSATYRVRGEVSEDAALVGRYVQFADWYAKVNSTRPGGYPSTARLSLNQAIKEHGLLPAEVRFDYRRDDGEEVTLHSTHVFGLELKPDDLERIAQAQSDADSMAEVLPDEYMKLQRR